MNKVQKLFSVVFVCVAVLHSACTYADFTTHFEKAEEYIHQEKYDEAIAESTQAITLATDDNDKGAAYLLRSTAYYLQGKYAEAIADSTQVIKLMNDDEVMVKAFAYVSRGLAYYAQGKYAEAIADSTQAIKLTTDDGFKAASSFVRGLAYYAQGKYDVAVLDFMEAIKGISFIKEHIEKFHKETLFTINLPSDADDENKAEASSARGLAYYLQGKYVEAIADLTQVIKLSTDDEFKAAVSFVRGLAYYAQGKYDAAVLDYTDALRYTTDNENKAEAMNNRSLACDELQKENERQYKNVKCHLYE